MLLPRFPCCFQFYPPASKKFRFCRSPPSGLPSRQDFSEEKLRESEERERETKFRNNSPRLEGIKWERMKMDVSIGNLGRDTTFRYARAIRLDAVTQRRRWLLGIEVCPYINADILRYPFSPVANGFSFELSENASLPHMYMYIRFRWLRSNATAGAGPSHVCSNKIKVSQRHPRLLRSHFIRSPPHISLRNCALKSSEIGASRCYQTDEIMS